MRYIMYIWILFFLVACGEQSFKKVDVRLLKSRNSEPNKSVEIDKPIEKLIVEANSSTETNGSMVVPVVEDSSKSEKLQLAELEAKVRAETLAMQSQYDLSLKKLATDNAKILKEKEVALAKLESDKEIAKAKELNKKEIALAQLQTQKDISKDSEKIALSRVLNDKDIALAKLNNQKELADKNIAFYKMIAMMIVGLVVLALLIVYFINRRKRKNELKIHEDELRHKEYMEASRQHNEHIGKMLDVITDANADTDVKKEIVRLLKEQGKKGNLIEHKK